jgi:hypothetical protein
MSRESEKEQKRQRAAYADALKHVMSHPLGRAFVWSELDRTGLYASLQSNNSGLTSWMIGRRDFGLELLNDLKTHCFGEYRVMEDEALAKELHRRLDQQQAESASQED